MGHEAAVTKKLVLEKVDACLNAANDAVATTEDLRGAHNAFSAQVLADIATLQTRAKAASAWCDQNEKAIAELNAALKDRPTLPQVGCAVTRLTLEDRARLDALWSMGFWARVRFVLFATLPTVPVCTADDSKSPFGAPMMPWEHP